MDVRNTPMTTGLNVNVAILATPATLATDCLRHLCHYAPVQTLTHTERAAYGHLLPELDTPVATVATVAAVAAVAAVASNFNF